MITATEAVEFMRSAPAKKLASLMLEIGDLIEENARKEVGACSLKLTPLQQSSWPEAEKLLVEKGFRVQKIGGVVTVAWRVDDGA